MENKAKKYLFDILTSINNIDSYIGEKKIFEKYENNVMLQDAVERNIEIMGEAMSKLLKIEPQIEISNARRIVDARNKIVQFFNYNKIAKTLTQTININTDFIFSL